MAYRRSLCRTGLLGLLGLPGLPGGTGGTGRSSSPGRTRWSLPRAVKRGSALMLAVLCLEWAVIGVAALAAASSVVTAQQSGTGTKRTRAKGTTAKRGPARAKGATKGGAGKGTSLKPATKKGAAKSSPARPAAATAVRALPPGWPVKGPPPLPGSILPYNRIVAYYGNPLSTRMGVLGEYRPTEMLRRLDREVLAWERADTLRPVKPALHLIAVVAQGSAGKDGKWRARMADSLIERVYGWARAKDALLFVDVQVGKSTLKDELPALESFLSRPDVHLGIDPEFSMKGRHAPGKRVGTYDARDVNWAIDYLAELVDKHKLPPKVLVIHRFTRPMLTNADKIKLDPRVQVVIHMDGWGAPSHKKASYDQYLASEPVQFTGFKLFYKNDVRGKGWRLMRPRDVLTLYPKPLYIQYQ